MTDTAKIAARLRCGLLTAFAGTVIGGVTVIGLAAIPSAIPSAIAAPDPSATAAPDPCAASQIAKTVGSVATSMGGYLDRHPETNQALTTISQQQAGPQSLAATKAYFDANPQAGKDLQLLQAPLVKLSAQCKLPITLPQLLGLMQTAQTPAGSLPGGLSSMQTVGVQGAPVSTPPAVTAPASAATQGAGPLPGPAAGAGR